MRCEGNWNTTLRMASGVVMATDMAKGKSACGDPTMKRCSTMSSKMMTSSKISTMTTRRMGDMNMDMEMGMDMDMEMGMDMDMVGIRDSQVRMWVVVDSMMTAMMIANT